VNLKWSLLSQTCCMLNETLNSYVFSLVANIMIPISRNLLEIQLMFLAQIHHNPKWALLNFGNFLHIGTFSCSTTFTMFVATWLRVLGGDLCQFPSNNVIMNMLNILKLIFFDFRWCSNCYFIWDNSQHKILCMRYISMCWIQQKKPNVVPCAQNNFYFPLTW
jgi:hypothetical protein